jgi:ribosomal protein S18 acetylase RimI-like enzyme
VSHAAGDLAELTFRRARPEDAAVLVPLIHASSAALIERSFRVGKADPEAFLRHDFLRGAGIFGHCNQWVLSTPDGTPVATVTAYRGRDYPFLLWATLRSAFVHFRALDLVRVLWRMSLLGSLFATPRRDGVFIANACVVASLRSRGLFSRLLLLALREVGQGTRVAELDVSFDNPRAQALYERLGWVVESERSRGDGASLVGFRRMTRAASR